MTQVVVSEYGELLALHRVFMELHFLMAPNDRDIIGSTFVANVSHRVLDAIIENDENTGRSHVAEQWRKWRRLDRTRREWPLLIQQLLLIEEWQAMTLELKRETIRCHASPFELDIDEVIRELERGNHPLR